MLLILCAMVFLPGCERNMELHHALSETDANEVVAALMDHGIHAAKEANKKGVSVLIRQADMAGAVNVLNARGLPRQERSSLGDVFKKEGVISTPVEERARYIYALSQELEFTLSQIEGVIMARVHVVLTERIAPGEPVQPSSAGIFIKHRPSLDPDVVLPRIRRMVASSIPGLADARQEKIAVVFVPGLEPAQVIQWSQVGPFKVDQASAELLRKSIFSVLGLSVLLALMPYLWRFLKVQPWVKTTDKAGNQTKNQALALVPGKKANS